MIRFFLILGANTLFALGGVAWIAAIGLVIYKIYLTINRDEINVWRIFDLVPDTFRDFGVKWLGKFAYVILDLDIAIFLVLVGTIFIAMAILLDIAAKRFVKSRFRPAFERRSRHDRRIKDRRETSDRRIGIF